MSEVKRDAKGRVLPGSANLKTKTQHVKAKAVSSKLKRELIKRYGATEGRIKHYLVALDIMHDAANEPRDRLKACQFIAERVDGKAVDVVDLAAVVETSSPLDRAIQDMTPEQLLELVRAARGH